MKKILFIGLTVVFFVASCFYFVINPIATALSFDDEIRLTRAEFENQIDMQMRFISGRTNFDAMVSDTETKYIDLKLFGFIPIKRIKVEIMSVENLIAGGMPIGFIANSHGVIVVENAPKHGLKQGDIIINVNGQDIESIEEFNKNVTNEMSIRFIRGGKEMSTRVSSTGPHGLWLKDESMGIGTLTYINPKNNNFSALGHQFVDHATGADVPIRGGNIYRTNLIGIEKSKGRHIGRFESTLRQGTDKRQGSLLSGSAFGIFGCLDVDSELLNGKVYQVASRFSVKPGKAKLLTTVDGINAREFDIEIVKTHYQTKRDTKSMIVRITDKELLNATGGIVYGMSGSPIIQNGKIIGALTHVINSDTTKGYGIYIDFVVP